MSATLTLYFPPEDIAAWQAQCRRLVTDFGMVKRDVLRVGGLSVLRSMQSSTTISRTRRTVRVSKKARHKRYKGNRLFVMEALDSYSGAMRNITIYYPDLATAKLHPGARVRNKGLGRTSWGWAMQRLFGQYSVSEYKGQRFDDVLRYFVNDDENTSKIEIENRLFYIEKALSGGRGPAVATAYARAAAVMKGRADHAIKVATSEAGY